MDTTVDIKEKKMKKMKKSVMLVGVLLLSFSLVAQSFAAEKLIVLPKPEITKGKPLMQALSLRQSVRDFSDTEISGQELSNLLWAANGVNRADQNGRTAPSACNLQEVDIYVARADGLFLYVYKEHALQKMLDKDIRKYAGMQRFTKEAPIDLIYVVDYAKMKHPIMNAKAKEFYAATDTGFVSQNVYLYCASEGLATVVLGWINKDKLHKKMELNENQVVILSQPVGYPKDEE